MIQWDINGIYPLVIFHELFHPSIRPSGAPRETAADQRAAAPRRGWARCPAEMGGWE